MTTYQDIEQAYAVLKPMFTTHEQLARAHLLDRPDDSAPRSAAGIPGPRPGPAVVRDSAAVVRLLAANRVSEAVRLGQRRLRAWGAPAVTSVDDAAQPHGPRLLAALLVPLSDGDLRRVFRRVSRREDDRQRRTMSTRTEE